MVAPRETAANAGKIVETFRGREIKLRRDAAFVGCRIEERHLKDIAGIFAISVVASRRGHGFGSFYENVKQPILIDVSRGAFILGELFMRRECDILKDVGERRLPDRRHDKLRLIPGAFKRSALKIELTTQCFERHGVRVRRMLAFRNAV